MSRRHGRPGRTTPKLSPTVRRDLARLADLDAARLGCTCPELDVTVRLQGRAATVTIGHDPHCPARAAGSAPWN